MEHPESTDNRLEIGDLFAIARRRRLVWIPLFLIIVATSLVLAYTLPSVYQSSSTILIELQEIPPDIVSTTIGGYVEARLSAVEQRINSSESLASIIKKFGVYPDMQDPAAAAVAIATMRSSILREGSVVNVAGPGGRTSTATVSFTISFEHENPQLAQQVTSELVTRYLAENTRNRVEKASEVSRFLSDEADRLTRSQEEIDTRLAAFKREHVNQLPDNADMNRRLMETTESNIVRSEQRIQALDDRKREIEARIGELNSNRLTVGDMLELKRSELAQAESRYSEIHPDVRNLRKEVHELEAQMNNPGKVYVVQGQAAPAYNSRLTATLQSELQEIIGNRNVEIAARDEQKGKLEEYAQRMLATPAVEKEYQQLVFDRDNTLNALRGIKQKLAEAQLAVQLELESKGEKLTVAQPATLPTEPIRPNRPAVALLGLVLAIALCIGLVALLERIDTSVHGSRDIRRIMHAQPIASIPIIPGA